MKVPLSLLWRPDTVRDYKIHFARRNYDGVEPLDILASDFDGQWTEWQEWRGQKNEFNRPFVFSLAQDYRQPNRWLFGGIWKVEERLSNSYRVSLHQELKSLIKRLYILLDHRDRATRCLMESYFDRFELDQILPKPFSARPFPGLSSLTISFAELESIVTQGVGAWRDPLAAVYGIYLLRIEGKNSNYVGAAYGTGGVWGRWSQYVASGHGGNALTMKLFGADPLGYARKNASFTLLEPIIPTVSPADVVERERHWMRALGTTSVDNLNSF